MNVPIGIHSEDTYFPKPVTGSPPAFLYRPTLSPSDSGREAEDGKMVMELAISD